MALGAPERGVTFFLFFSYGWDDGISVKKIAIWCIGASTCFLMLWYIAFETLLMCTNYGEFHSTKKKLQHYLVFFFLNCETAIILHFFQIMQKIWHFDILPNDLKNALSSLSSILWNILEFSDRKSAKLGIFLGLKKSFFWKLERQPFFLPFWIALSQITLKQSKSNFEIKFVLCDLIVRRSLIESRIRITFFII